EGPESSRADPPGAGPGSVPGVALPGVAMPGTDQVLPTIWSRCGMTLREADDEREADTGPAAPAPAAGSPRWRAVVRRSLVAMFLVVVAVAVAVELRGQDWSALRSATRHRPPTALALFVAAALLANAASLLLTMVSWRETLIGLGERVEALAAARI